MKKILVIDYDQSSLQTLHKTLTQEGFEVVLASDGQTGWEKFQAEKPDLVLMEAMLSKIHGFELCDRITKDPVRKVPVFIMTGVYKDRVYRTEALRTYGASEYFEKPLDMLKFVASIHALLTVPDIKPEPGAKPATPTKPGNGEPAEGPQVMPVMPAPKEEKRRVEPPPPKAPKVEASRVRPSSGPRSGGDLGLGLETVLESKPGREEPIRPEFLPDFGPDITAPAKPKHAPEPKLPSDDDLKLESLLNIHPDKTPHRRPEREETIDPLRILSQDLEDKPLEHPRKDHGAEDIDKLLKTTLADFGLETEKRKPAKPVPPPPPPPAPAPEKPRAAATLPPKPKPAPAPVHPPAPPAPPAPAKEPAAAAHAAPAPAGEMPKPVPPPHMPAAVAEKAKPQPAPPPAVAAPKAQPLPKPKPAPQPAPPAPAPAPKAEAKPEAKMPAPVHEPHKSAEARMFKDIYTVEKKKSPVPFIAVGAGLIVVAALGFFLLRPKHPPKPEDAGLSPAVTQTQSSVPEKTQETAVPSLSEEKLKAVKTKPQVVQKPADPLPSAADAIVPPQIADASRLSAKTPERKPEAKVGTGAPAAGQVQEPKTDAAKTTDAKVADSRAAQGQEPPPAGAESGAAAGATAGGGETASQPGPSAKANPGDLVDLAAVDDQPKIIKSVDPVYPAQAKRFGKEGAVTVNALINEAGAVIETGILKGLKDDMGLEKAAADAVRKWKFQPAKKDGVSVKVWKPIVIAFRADKSRIP